MAQFESAIGPLWSNWGFKVWNLLLAKNEIIGQRYSTWETWKLAIHLQLGVPSDPGRVWRENPRSAPFNNGRGFRHYVVSEVEAITVTVGHGNNHVTITRSNGQSDRYDIQQRPLTQHFMRVLQAMYPSLYRESGVPKTVMGRLLKL